MAPPLIGCVTISPRLIVPRVHSVGAGFVGRSWWAENLYMSTRMPAAAHDGRAVLVFVLSGLVGGAVAAMVAWLALPSRVPPSFAFDPYLSVTPLVIATAAAIGGVLVGWFLAALALTRAPGRFRCPQCGSASDLKDRSCTACGLSFG
jgi:hypothetical protein